MPDSIAPGRNPVIFRRQLVFEGNRKIETVFLLLCSLLCVCTGVWPRREGRLLAAVIGEVPGYQRAGRRNLLTRRGHSQGDTFMELMVW